MRALMPYVVLAFGAYCVLGAAAVAAQDGSAADVEGAQAAGDVQADEPDPDDADWEDEEEWEEPEPQVGWYADDPAGLAEARLRGRAVYRRHCASCHGRRGNGRGAAARFLAVRPRDFRGGVYKWRATPTGALASDDDLYRSIRRGAPGTEMPAWQGRLRDSDIRAVVQFIKTFSSRYGDEEVPAAVPMPRQAPAFDGAARRRGRLLYLAMRCWTCHALDGTGVGATAQDLVNDDGEPAFAYDFTSGRMPGGTRPIDVFRTFTTGVNGTPMPSYLEGLMVGSDGFEDMDEFEVVLNDRGMTELRAFIAAMPTTEAIWAMTESDRMAWADQRRWDLVAYIQALSSQSPFWRYLFTRPYLTE